MTSDLRVHHLNCAHITTMKIGGQHLACHVMMVETPSSGLVLIDSGIGTADYADIGSRLGVGFARFYARPKVDPSLAAINQIRAMGFDPRDVRHIVQTHLDLDHVGGLADFPQATVHVQGTELQAATQRKGMKARGRYRPPMWAHRPTWQTYTVEGEPWHGFEAVRNLRGLPPEILFVPLPGHTMGHCGVAIDTDQGWVLDAGDAFFDPREVHGPTRKVAFRVGLFEAAVTTDKGLRVYNQNRLRTFCAEHPEVTVFAAHDPTGFPGGTPHVGARTRVASAGTGSSNR